MMDVNIDLYRDHGLFILHKDGTCCEAHVSPRWPHDHPTRGNSKKVSREIGLIVPSPTRADGSMNVVETHARWCAVLPRSEARDHVQLGVQDSFGAFELADPYWMWRTCLLDRILTGPHTSCFSRVTWYREKAQALFIFGLERRKFAMHNGTYLCRHIVLYF